MKGALHEGNLQRAPIHGEGAAMGFWAFQALCFRTAAADLWSWAREHLKAALLGIIIAFPAVPLARFLGSSMTEEVMAIIVQSFIGPALLVAGAFVIFWVRTPHKLWQSKSTEVLSGLSLRFEQMTFGARSAEMPDRSAITVIATISNPTERPSIARDWEAWLIGGGQELRAEIHHVPKINLNSGFGTMTMTGDDALAVKASSPVPAGGMVQGYILCAFPLNNDDAVAWIGRVFSVSFLDVWGNKVTASHTITGKALEFLPFHPAMKSKVSV